MSPEQVQGQTLDSRTDIYSFGVTCYHMLAGQPPFTGDNSFGVAVQHVQAEPVPLHDIRPDLPAELCAIVHKMMAKKPADRYQTAREILKDIKRVAEQQSGTSPAAAAATADGSDARGSVAAATPKSKAARRKVAIIAASIVVVALAGAAIGNSLKRGENNRNTDAAIANSDSRTQPAPISADRERELELIKRVEASRTPPDLPNKERVNEIIWDGVRDRVDLAYLYLYERPSRDLDSAAKLFTEMRKSHVPQYQQVGKIGEAIILAFRDKAEESVRLFEECQVGLQLPNLRTQLGAAHSKNLIRMIRDALYHDHSYYQKKDMFFPKILQFLENFEPGNSPPGGRPRGDRMPSSKPESKPPGSQ